MPATPPTDAPQRPRSGALSHRQPLRGVRVLSLALNLPGPAALARLVKLGAQCSKLEPPTGDPMFHYTPQGYAHLHQGVQVQKADLKTHAGQERLHKALARTDVLLTSFRPSAMKKLGLSWRGLQRAYPQLSWVAIVGAPGPLAEVPGHDLTYQAEVDLVPSLQLPASLFADMGGALMAAEATLAAVLAARSTGRGGYHEVALSEAARFLAWPRAQGMTTAQGAVGGAHAGYRLYPCQDGRVAVAALEPHFAQRLCAVAGIALSHPVKDLFKPQVHHDLAGFFLTLTRDKIQTLAQEHDIPMMALA
jgi:alpha-methylacyl-CoA racemase